jgi:predicted PurR-regulated permease PerM
MQTPPNPEFLLCFSRGFLWRLLLFIGIFLLLAYVGDVVLIVFAGILLAIILRGITGYAARIPVISPQWAYTAVLTGIVIVVAALCWALGPRVVAQAHEIAKSIPVALLNIRAQLEHYSWGKDVVHLVTQNMQSRQITAHAGAYANAVTDGITDAVVIVAIAAFLGSNPPFYRSGLLQLVPKNHRNTAADLLDHVTVTARDWLLGQLIPMSVLGIGTFVGLEIMGVPLAFTLALFTALMLFIPYVGSIIAYIPTALVALMQSPMKLVYVTILYLGVHIAEGYVVTPLAQRHAVRLPPALTLLSQLFMWKVAGLLGVIIATPLAAIGLVVVQKLYLKREPSIRE